MLEVVLLRSSNICLASLRNLVEIGCTLPGYFLGDCPPLYHLLEGFNHISSPPPPFFFKSSRACSPSFDSTTFQVPSLFRALFQDQVSLISPGLAIQPSFYSPNYNLFISITVTILPPPKPFPWHFLRAVPSICPLRHIITVARLAGPCQYFPVLT